MRDRSIVACCARERLCDRCLEDAMAHLRGVAACRGEYWARTVAERCGRSRPWPSSARARAIALAKVEDLTRDERLRGRLADEALRWAARWWGS